MLHQLNNEKYVFNFSKDNAPVLYVDSKDTIEIDTIDCFCNQIKTEDYVLDKLDWHTINPVTGPIFINNAEPGDVLKISIKKIEISGDVVIVAGPAMGDSPLGDYLVDTTIKVCQVQDNCLQLTPKLKVPLNKMIGVIGTAPTEGAIATGIPDYHGGNMDCKMITEGADIYLPVNVAGGLLALGDIHAAQGDGEVGVCGGEAASKITLTVEVLKDQNIPTPLIVNDQDVMLVVSHPDLETACNQAVTGMAKFIEKRLSVPKDIEVMLLTLKGDLQICQIVDPSKTVRMSLAKEYFAENPIK